MPASVHHFYAREQIREEASLWVAKLDRELSGDEIQALTDWLARGDAHRDALFELAALWDDLCVLNQLSSLFPFDPDHLSTSDNKRNTRWMGIAASLVAGVLALGSYFWQPMEAQSVVSAEAIAYDTRVGENRVISLADGSSVHLNTSSHIQVRYSATQRHIELLSGEARFSVAKDANRPFVVQAGDSAVQALGTIFNVEYVGDVVEVLVTEGKVQVSHPETPAAEKITILPGQWTSIDRSGARLATTLPEEVVQKELAWRNGVLIFRGEPLDKALGEVARYTHTTFRVADEQAAQLKIAGFFKAGDVDGLLLSLTENFPVTYVETDGEITISSLSDSKPTSN